MTGPVATSAKLLAAPARLEDVVTSGFPVAALSEVSLKPGGVIAGTKYGA